MTDWSLRLARAEDAECLPPIERAAARLFASDPGLGNIDPDDVLTVDQHRNFISKGHCLVAAMGGRIVGFLSTQPFRRELHIWELSVHPDAQRLGIGAGLMRGCMIDARNAGFSALTLTTFRDISWNAPFYGRLGFAEIEDFAVHARLAATLEHEAEQGLPMERRCAMICFLD